MRPWLYDTAMVLVSVASFGGCAYACERERDEFTEAQRRECEAEAWAKRQQCRLVGYKCYCREELDK